MASVLTVPVELSFLDANEIVAALEQRARTLRGHIENGVQDDALDAAIIRTLAAEDRLRKAFHIPSEAELDGAFEAASRAFEELVEADAAVFLPDVPLALDVYWNRGA